MRKNKIVSIVVIILLLPYVLSVFIKGVGAIWMIRNLENDTVCQENSGQKEVTYDQIEIIKKDKANYVREVQILAQVVTGECFRTKLHLKSSCFSFQEDEEGLEGKNDEEILQYFFPATVLSVYEDEEKI